MPSTAVTQIPSWQVHVRSASGSMTPSENKLLAYILKDPSSVMGSSVQDLAESAGVSPATVTRFLHHLGYTGLKEFKCALMESSVLSEPERRSSSQIRLESSDSTASVKEKVFAGCIEALYDTMKILDDKELEKAIDHLYKAPYVEIIAVGGSAAVARTAVHNFRKCGMRVNMVNDLKTNYIDTESFDPDDVVLIISLSGETREIVSCAHTAKRKGAYVICLTGNPASMLSRLSDCRLISTSRSPLMDDDTTCERGAQIAIIYALYAGVRMRQEAEQEDEA